MEALTIFYCTNISISSLLACLTIYVIAHKSTMEMGKFKWLLLFITGSIYSEAIYFTILFAPVIPVYPVPYIYSTGILWTIFKVPVNIQWGIMIFILGIMATSIIMSFTHRYMILLPLSPWGASVNPVTIARLKRDADYWGIIAGGVGGSLGMFCFKTAEETKKIILEMDPIAIVPEGAQTFEYGLPTQIWAFLSTSCVILATPIIICMVIHSNRIIQAAVCSERTIAMHKEAIRSLVIQFLAMVAVVAIPVFIFGFCITWHLIGQLPSSMFILSVFGAGLFSMESFFGSIAILTTIRVYRVYLIRKVYYKTPAKTRVVSVISDSSMIFN